MTSDDTRALLTLAAKAVGIEGRLVKDSFYISAGNYLVSCWNPIESSADCGELEATLRIDIGWYPKLVRVWGVEPSILILTEDYADHNGDRQAARRLAVTRLAARIGEMMG